jgi:hypothetical protein
MKTMHMRGYDQRHYTQTLHWPLDRTLTYRSNGSKQRFPMNVYGGPLAPSSGALEAGRLLPGTLVVRLLFLMGRFIFECVGSMSDYE